MKICFLTSEYAIPQLGRSGGIGVFLKNHARGLAEKGIDTTVFTFGSKVQLFKDAGVQIFQIRDLGSWLNPLRQFYLKTKLPGYITFKIILTLINRLYISLYFSYYVHKNKFNILEFNDYGGHGAFFIGSTPIVIRCHGSALVLYKYFGYSRRAVDIPFEKILFNRFNKNVIAVSEFSAEITMESFDLNKKPIIIYNGIKVHNNLFIEAEPYLTSKVIQKSMFYFGAIRERKGIDIAAKVFNQIVEKFPDASLHVAGNNNNNHWQDVATNIQSYKARKNTILYGNLPQNKIYEHLQKAHVVLFPSYGENFSMAVLEAMTLGKIVIVSDIPSYKEIVVDRVNGFVAKSLNNYENIIEQIFEDKFDLSKISKNASFVIKDKFALKDTLSKNITYYQSLL